MEREALKGIIYAKSSDQALSPLSEFFKISDDTGFFRIYLWDAFELRCAHRSDVDFDFLIDECGPGIVYCNHHYSKNRFVQRRIAIGFLKKKKNYIVLMTTECAQIKFFQRILQGLAETHYRSSKQFGNYLKKLKDGLVIIYLF